VSYSDLWNTQAGRTAWVENAPIEQVEWLQGLADLIVERGSEPTWTQVGEKFRACFELDAPTDTTLMNAVRRMVKSG